MEMWMFEVVEGKRGTPSVRDFIFGLRIFLISRMCHYVSDGIPGNSATVQLVAIYSHLSLKSHVLK
jgi:hypothetical protein